MQFQTHVNTNNFIQYQQPTHMIELTNDSARVATEVLSNKNRMPNNRVHALDNMKPHLKALTENSRARGVVPVQGMNIAFNPVWRRSTEEAFVVGASLSTTIWVPDG